jgi:hypothetical protein
MEADVIEGTALVVRESAALATPMPTVTPAEAREAMEQYLAVCNAVLTADDYQELRERGKVKRFKKKSAVKKLQTFWSVSVSVRDVQRDDLGDGHFGFRVIATASLPSGRMVEATGGCSTFEERFELKRYDDESPAAYAARSKKAMARSYHDVMSTAETRATNRAVMNCIGVGGGEVTAEEIQRPRRDDREREPEPAGPTKAEQLVERAIALGVLDPLATLAEQKIALRAWAGDRGVASTVEAITEALNAVEKGKAQKPAKPAKRAPVASQATKTGTAAAPPVTANRILLRAYANVVGERQYRELLARHWGVATSKALTDPQVVSMLAVLAELLPDERRAQIDAEHAAAVTAWAERQS